MGTNFELTVTASGRAAVPGAPSGYVEDIFALEHELWQAVDPTDCMSAILAGGIPGLSGSALTERDRANTAQLWTAKNTLLALETSASVMKGQKRFVTSGQASEGFGGNVKSLASLWTGFTLFLPDIEVNSLVANQALFSIGTGGANSSLLAFINTLGRMVFHHGVGGGGTSAVTTATVTPGERNTIIFTSHKLGDLNWEANIYLNSVTPVATATINKNLPASAVGAWFGIDGNSLASNLKSMGGYVLDSAVSEDADALAALIDIGQRMRNLD